MLFKDDKVARIQHNAIRNNVGWFKWKHDLLEVTGRDAARFLDYLYVNSIAKLAIGKSKYTTMLNEAGEILDDVIVMHVDENMFWVSTLYLPELIEWIEKHKDGYDIEYRDLTSEVDMFAVQGPKARVLMNAVLDKPVDELKFYASEDTTVAGVKVKVHRSGFTGELGYEIYCDEEESSKVEAALAQAGIDIGAENITVLEVYVRGLSGEKGYALRQDLYGLNPYEADMGWSVDLSKSFIGKEAVERAHEEGPKRQLVGLEYEGPYNDICQGEVVKVGGIEVGRVTASMYGYTIDKNIGYAVVERDKAPKGTEVKIGCHNAPAIVVDRIWYDPENKRARV